MKNLTIIGVVLIVLGLAGFVVPRITYTEETTALDLGPVEITTEQERSITIPDVAAGAAVAVGALLVIVGATRKS
ncbi:MAG: hypothetical protein R6W77_07295 [Trueperaceae bacterium]